MFYSRKSNLRIENIHKRAIREAFNKYEKNLKDLFADHDEKHLQFLATEVFKSINKLIPQFSVVFF